MLQILMRIFFYYEKNNDTIHHMIIAAVRSQPEPSILLGLRAKPIPNGLTRSAAGCSGGSRCRSGVSLPSGILYIYIDICICIIIVKIIRERILVGLTRVLVLLMRVRGWRGANPEYDRPRVAVVALDAEAVFSYLQVRELLELLHFIYATNLDANLFFIIREE